MVVAPDDGRRRSSVRQILAPRRRPENEETARASKERTQPDQAMPAKLLAEIEPEKVVSKILDQNRVRQQLTQVRRKVT